MFVGRNMWNIVFGVSVWAIWMARSQVIFIDQQWNFDQVVNRAKFVSFEVIQGMGINVYILVSPYERHVRWVSPQSGWVKFNVDDSVRRYALQL